MLSSHVIYMLRGSPGILHGYSLSHYWECSPKALFDLPFECQTTTIYQIITQNLDTCTWHTLHEPFMSFYTTSIQGLNIATHIPAPIMKQALSEMAWGFAIKEIESEHENTVNKFYSHGVWEYIMKMSCQFTCEFWNIQQRLTTLKSSCKRQTELKLGRMSN